MSRRAAVDLLSSSVETIEPLPTVVSEGDGQPRGRGGGIVEGGGDVHGDGDDLWIKITEEKAQRGSADAQFSLGQYYYSRGDYEMAVQHFQHAEASGSSQASYQLAVMFYDGLGTQRDPERGFQYMLTVAQSEKEKETRIIRAGAQYNIGRAYFQGYGVRQSDEEAERWWLKAGEGRGGGSVVRAQNTLGMLYSRQETLDLGKSFHWHSKAAENGHLESMAAVGLMSINGRGCPRDEPAGLRWLKRATEGGSLYGSGLLALHYFTSKLFSKATEIALRVSEVTADAKSLSALERQGVALACFTLARCLQLGHALDQDQERALQYYTKAKDYDKATVAELHTQIINGQL